MKNFNLTAIIEKSEDGWYSGQIQEFPAAISQGKTIDELKENLLDAFKMVIEDLKESTKKESTKRKTFTRRLLLHA